MIPIFTRDKNILSGKGIVSANEWSYTQSRGAGFPLEGKFNSKEGYLAWARKHDLIKLKTADAIAPFLADNNVKNVLCLGAGPAYVEYYLLKKIKNIKFKITDFDSFTISKVRELLPEFKDAEVFDFKKDDFSRFKRKFDSVLMVHAIEVLDNNELRILLKKLYDIKCENIFIFAFLMNWIDILKYFIKKMVRLFIPNAFGRIHAYGRTKEEFRRVLNSEYFSINKMVGFNLYKTKHRFLHLVRN